MSAEGWRQEHFLDSRLSYFVAAADAGGGASRNRRRLAAGRELLKDVGDALDVAFLTLSERRSRALVPLRSAVEERLATVTAAGFVWKRREPLLPGFSVEAIAAAFEAASADTIGILEDCLNPLEVPSASSRSRSPVPRSLDTPSGFERVAVPPVPRPRIEGCPTPTPPAPRPVISGQKTPLPPKARSKGSEPSIPSQTSDPSRAPRTDIAPFVGSEPSSASAVSAVPAADIVVSDEEDHQAEASSPAELCVVYPANDLWPVINWSAETIRQGYRRIISLDEHKVADRDISQTTALLTFARGVWGACGSMCFVSNSSSSLRVPETVLNAESCGCGHRLQRTCDVWWRSRPTGEDAPPKKKHQRASWQGPPERLLSNEVANLAN